MKLTSCFSLMKPNKRCLTDPNTLSPYRQCINHLWLFVLFIYLHLYPYNTNNIPCLFDMPNLSNSQFSVTYHTSVACCEMQNISTTQHNLETHHSFVARFISVSHCTSATQRVFVVEPNLNYLHISVTPVLVAPIVSEGVCQVSQKLQCQTVT